MRTDLAIEAAPSLARPTAHTDGVDVVGMSVTAEDAALIGKPAGRYITATVAPLGDDEHDLERKARVIGTHLKAILPPEGCVLVVGLGNEAITPDALGPRTASMVLATRHIRGEFARSVGLTDLRPTAVLRTGVLGNTGMESCEVAAGICRELRPSAVIAVDALAARSMERLGCTVQITDTGIAPGSGVGNNRQVLNRDSLGVPVIALGVPTVVDASTLVQELSGIERQNGGEQMMVTPREIDLIIARASRLVAMSIHAALHPSYSPLELLSIAL